MGQFSFASSAAASNFSGAAPGISPRTSSALETTVQLSPTLSKVTFALTSSRFGGVPALARPAESAIAKHEACAAARSSSGLVLPGHERGPALGHLEDRAAKLVPGRSPLGALDRRERRPFRRTKVVHLPDVLLPAPRRALHPRRGEDTEVRKQPLAHFLAHDVV